LKLKGRYSGRCGSKVEPGGLNPTIGVGFASIDERLAFDANLSFVSFNPEDPVSTSDFEAQVPRAILLRVSSERKGRSKMRTLLVTLLLTTAVACDVGITDIPPGRGHTCIGSTDYCESQTFPLPFSGPDSTLVRGTVYVGTEPGSDSLELLVEFWDAELDAALVSVRVDSAGRYEMGIRRMECGTSRTWVGVEGRPAGGSNEPFGEILERAPAFDSVPSPCPDTVQAKDIVIPIS